MKTLSKLIFCIALLSPTIAFAGQTNPFVKLFEPISIVMLFFFFTAAFFIELMFLRDRLDGVNSIWLKNKSLNTYLYVTSLGILIIYFIGSMFIEQKITPATSETVIMFIVIITNIIINKSDNRIDNGIVASLVLATMFYTSLVIYTINNYA
ncbi:MAG: hypothetical protein H6779_00330 [Candidatus Nomurabacteria bacterium]|nr:MAG: hypothetical protein H6779_00330 [Candidatus Nomurabacteria bacterium]